MKKRSILSLTDKRITIAALILVIFGSLMIASAEMGNNVGDTSYLTSIILRQLLYVILGIIAYLVLLHLRVYRFTVYIFGAVYLLILVLLLACRAFGQINGAYAWINIGGGATIQPSEFAKVFMIGFGAKLLANDRKEKNLTNLKIYIAASLVYFVIIALYQHDFGSGAVLLIICYCIVLIPDFREYRKCQMWMKIGIFIAIGLFSLLMSKPFTEFLKAHSGHYMIGRILAAADPFLYQYDNGYHLIMSLVSFANGGIFGLGYGNSIHKYMNFPNPSNDFILPVIVEELGIVGFVGLLIAYGVMLYPLVSCSLKTRIIGTKIVLLGVFLYFIVHFILNVGGVSGFIPLTGVPLLMISSGGSSLMASLASLGLAQSEIVRNRILEDEDNSR